MCQQCKLLIDTINREFKTSFIKCDNVKQFKEVVRMRYNEITHKRLPKDFRRFILKCIELGIFESSKKKKRKTKKRRKK